MMRGAPVATMIMLATSTTVGCGEPPRPAAPTCEVGDDIDDNTQALQVLRTVLDVVLGDDLGGLTCRWVDAVGCDELFADCIGAIDAVVGEPLEVTVTLRSQQLGNTIQSVTVVSDCGWSLDDESGFNIDPGTDVPLQVAFVGEAVGACTGRLDVVVTSTTGDGGFVTLPVTLNADVTAD